MAEVAVTPYLIVILKVLVAIVMVAIFFALACDYDTVRLGNRGQAMSRYFFLLEFRKHLEFQRFLRRHRKERLAKRVRHSINGIYVSQILEMSWEYSVVFELTPRCGYVREIGTKWYELPAAIDSANRLAATRARAQTGVRT